MPYYKVVDMLPSGVNALGWPGHGRFCAVKPHNQPCMLVAYSPTNGHVGFRYSQDNGQTWASNSLLLPNIQIGSRHEWAICSDYTYSSWVICTSPTNTGVVCYPLAYDPAGLTGWALQGAITVRPDNANHWIEMLGVQINPRVKSVHVVTMTNDPGNYNIVLSTCANLSNAPTSWTTTTLDTQSWLADFRCFPLGHPIVDTQDNVFVLWTVENGNIGSQSLCYSVGSPNIGRTDWAFSAPVAIESQTVGEYLYLDGTALDDGSVHIVYAYVEYSAGPDIYRYFHRSYQPGVGWSGATAVASGTNLNDVLVRPLLNETHQGPEFYVIDDTNGSTHANVVARSLADNWTTTRLVLQDMNIWQMSLSNFDSNRQQHFFWATDPFNSPREIWLDYTNTEEVWAMSAFSNYMEQSLLNLTLRGTAWAPPANVYISLHTADPTDAGTGAEVSTAGTAYARVPVPTATGWDAPVVSGTAYVVKNTLPISFPTPTAPWGLVQWFAIWDASTGGNMLYHGPLAVAKTINTGDSIQFGAQDLQISLD